MKTQTDFKELQELHKNQLKENRKKINDRKARTHRLIVRGAIIEAAQPECKLITDDEFQTQIHHMLQAYKIHQCSPQESCGSIPRKSALPHF